MSGRVAVVTGAARGIGAATTRLLASQGYSVLTLDWCAGDNQPATVPYALPTTADLRALTAAAGPGVVPSVADVRERDALEAAVSEAVGRWGRLDVAVAAAAVVLGGRPVWETTDAELQLMWDIDVRGVWNIAAAAVPAMLAGEDPAGCRFVAVASAAAEHGLHRLAGYNTVKHAVVGVVRGLAADLVGTGVTAVAVSPGSTRTDMLSATAATYDLEDSLVFAEQQLVRRLLEPDEIAAAIGFCCSREGAVLNGSVVSAQGGFPG